MSTAYFYVNGSVGAYIRIPPIGAGPFVGPAALTGTPTFLGHTEKTPKPSYVANWKPVFSSQTGEMIPTDKLYMGTDVKIVLPLQRFDYDVVQLLKAAPRYGRVNAPGVESYLDIGALLQRNGLGFELWLRNEFHGTVNAAAYPNLPIGTYFICCNTAGIVPDDMGRNTETIQLLIEANWVQAHPIGPRICYSQDPSMFRNLPGIG